MYILFIPGILCMLDVQVAWIAHIKINVSANKQHNNYTQDLRLQAPCFGWQAASNKAWLRRRDVSYRKELHAKAVWMVVLLFWHPGRIVWGLGGTKNQWKVFWPRICNVFFVNKWNWPSCILYILLAKLSPITGERSKEAKVSRQIMWDRPVRDSRMSLCRSHEFHSFA